MPFFPGYKPSEFYEQFSMTDLARESSSLLELGEDVVKLGGGGGSMGHSAASGREGSGTFHKSDSCSFKLRPGALRAEQTLKFITSLQSSVLEQLTESNVQIFSSAGATRGGSRFDYEGDGIKGRVEISSQVRGDHYILIATLRETSTNPTEHYRPFPIPATGTSIATYHVVAFLVNDTHSQRFYEAGHKAIEESIQRIGSRLRNDPLQNERTLLSKLEYAEVHSWMPLPLEVKQRMPEQLPEVMRMLLQKYPNLEGYENYARVYFLNETALRMYREMGTRFEVLKTIAGSEIESLRGGGLRGPYLPKDN